MRHMINSIIKVVLKPFIKASIFSGLKVEPTSREKFGSIPEDTKAIVTMLDATAIETPIPTVRIKLIIEDTEPYRWRGTKETV